MTKPVKRISALLVAVVTVSQAAGCGMNRRFANNAIRELPHSNVAVEYTCTPLSGSEVEKSSFTPDDSAKQILTITYPHPSPKYDRKYAEVTLRREGVPDDSASTNAVAQLVTNPFKKQESLASGTNDSVLRLPIPREELEFLLRDLVADSYFDREDRAGDVSLRVTLGSRTTHKTWDRIASFDQLAQRVTEENEHRQRRAAKIIPASAELLPPTMNELNEPIDETVPEYQSSMDLPTTQPRGRMHAVPKF